MEQQTSIFQKYSEKALVYLAQYGLKILAAAIVLFVGFKLAQWVSRLFSEACLKKHLDISLTHFLSGVVKVSILAFAFMIALDKVGITVSPIIAAVSAMLFGASFAIQAPLSNYAAGLAIIFTRPFTVGNTISIQGVSGIVEDVNLSSTILINENGEKITIPNKHIVGEILHNSMENKVAESEIGIGYGDNPEEAIRLISEVLRKFPEIAKNPAPQVGIKAFGDSAITIAYRYWAPTSQFFKNRSDVNLGVFQALKKARITIPFPQREVRVVGQSEGTDTSRVSQLVR